MDVQSADVAPGKHRPQGGAAAYPLGAKGIGHDITRGIEPGNDLRVLVDDLTLGICSWTALAMSPS